MNRTVHVALSGGGLDSVSVIAHLMANSHLDHVYHIDYEQNSTAQEYHASLLICDWFDEHAGKRIPMTQIRAGSHLAEANPEGTLFNGGTKDMVRGRNMHLISTAALTALRDFGDERPIRLHTGLCKENMMFEDADKAFAILMDQMLGRSFGNIHGNGYTRLMGLHAPLIDRPKLETMYWTVKEAYATAIVARPDTTQQAAFDLVFKTTFTCWTPPNARAIREADNEQLECGTCFHCTKRQRLAEEVAVMLKKEGWNVA